MRRRILTGIFVIFLLLAMIVLHQTKAVDEGGNLVLYDSAKIGVIEKEISLDLKKGLNEVPLKEIEGLNIAEITLKPLSEGVEIYGIVSQNVLGKNVFEANIGESVTIKLKSGEVISGKFLGYQDGKIAIQGDGYYLIEPNEIAYMKLAKLGEEGKSSAYAVIKAQNDGTYKFKLIYRVSPIGWSSRYKLYLGKNAELYGYVLIDNPTNKSWEDINVLLVSGEVQFYQPYPVYREVYALAEKTVQKAPPMEPQKIEAFYLYKLGQMDINAFEQKLIPYVYQEGEYTREYLYESYPWGRNTDVYEIISMKTEKVLPAGIVEIYKEMEESTVLIGEQYIEHTPKGDILRLKIGKDIDLKGETVVLEEKHAEKYSYYKVKVSIENFGEETKEVIIRHYKYRGKILSSTTSPINETANYVEFKVTVKPGEKKEIIFEYEVTY